MLINQIIIIIIIITGVRYFPGRMPFQSPNQQCQRNEGIEVVYKLLYDHFETTIQVHLRTQRRPCLPSPSNMLRQRLQ